MLLWGGDGGGYAGLGAGLGEIPARERGYDGSLSRECGGVLRG